ncbi:MAG: hypothetical protein DRO92_03145, partial [Candidatus Altiarchaeales archaeon]
SIWKGESILAYAQWNEDIYAANITYNSTSPSLEVYTPDTISGNWTNHTITTNSSWLVGIHVVKINASDWYNNWNNTLPFLNFTVWGRSKVSWYSPTGDVQRGTIPLRCRVFDKDNNEGIGNYQVNFYDENWDYIASSNTNDSGIATVNWDASTKSVGPKTLHCTISNNPSAYYNTTEADSSASGTFNLIGVLNVTIDNPVNGSSFHKGATIQLNSTTIDDNNTVVTPDNATWYNSTSQIATGEDTTWQIPLGYETGPELIRINVSKQYYHPDSENVTIEIWGYSNITWISPDDGNISQGSTVQLICQVNDVNGSYGIQGYPVRFYYKNSTETNYNYLGVSDTNSTGHAVYNWNTGGLGLDNYTVMCNISDNSSLYYNITEDNKANTTIELVTPAGILEVHLMLPPYIPGLGNASLNSGYKVGQNKKFVIKANVTCRNANCGNVQGTVRYNSTSGSPDKAINTTADTPFYIIDSPALNPKSCSNNPLDVNETCIINWTINATGSIGSIWKLDVLFDATEATSNNTDYTTIEITKILILILSNDTIDFGTLLPGDTCNASLTNPITITLHNNSNDADGIYIKGTNLTSGSNQIGVKNITWALVDNCLLGDNLTGYWQLIQADVTAGTNIDTYYFINIPPTPSMTYTGSAYIMANTSLS